MVHGVGPRIAGCVLSVAGGRAGVFPVDTRVHRIGLAPPDADHGTVCDRLGRDVPAAVWLRPRALPSAGRSVSAAPRPVRCSISPTEWGSTG